MIEINYIDDKPQVTINKKKLKTWDKLQEGCVYAEDDNVKITFADIENIELRTIPNKLIVFFSCEKDNPKYYNFDASIIIESKNDNESCITFSGSIKSKLWNIEYFYSVFEIKIQELLNTIHEVSCSYDDIDNVYFHCLFNINQSLESKTIGDLLEEYNKKIDLVYQKTFQELNKKIIDENLISETVSLKFNFPKKFKGICKQYLSYFEKFLLDQNIECQMSLIDTDDITYMTIDVDETIIDTEKLKQALVGYFTLPIVARENINFDTYNIATQQLIANIEHLKSQLRLANLTIAQYENNSLANSPKPIEYVLVDSLDEDSKIKLFDGLIQIGKILKLKFFGIEIEFSIPKLINKFQNNLTIEEFEQISEDIKDLVVVNERKDEPITSHEDLLQELKQDGIL